MEGTRGATGPQHEQADAATPVEEYSRVYQEHHSRLVAYARTLTGNGRLAEDLTAEAHFRVWRQISTGHRVKNIPAYLAATIRNLAATLGHAERELPQSPEAQQRWADDSTTVHGPEQRIAHVSLLAEVLAQLPERWTRALWLAEVEELPLDVLGARLGTSGNAAGVLLHRAREGMRQAFLRTQPGEPADPACAVHWERMPAYVRGVGAPRHATALKTHADECLDCRARLLALETANRRLPVLVGPALLLLSGGAARLLLPAAAGATAAGADHTHGAHLVRAAGGGARSSSAGRHRARPRGVRQLSARMAVTGGAAAAGLAAAAVIAVAAIGSSTHTAGAAAQALLPPAPAATGATGAPSSSPVGATVQTGSSSPAAGSASPALATGRATASSGTTAPISLAALYAPHTSAAATATSQVPYVPVSPSAPTRSVTPTPTRGTTPTPTPRRSATPTPPSRPAPSSSPTPTPSHTRTPPPTASPTPTPTASPTPAAASTPASRTAAPSGTPSGTPSGNRCVPVGQGGFCRPTQAPSN